MVGEGCRPKVGRYPRGDAYVVARDEREGYAVRLMHRHVNERKVRMPQSWVRLMQLQVSLKECEVLQQRGETEA